MITESLTSGPINPATFLGQGVWMPPQASTYAGSVDGLWNLIFWYSTFFTVLIMALVILFVVLYRKRPGHKEQKTASHSLPLELFWTIPPSLFLVVFFFWGLNTYLDMNTPPEDSYQIHVTAMKWNWNFTYPNGVITDELHVPVDTPVTLTMESSDVIHSLFIPAFRAKMDVVPGRFQKMWFEATKTGEYHLFCTEYCGTEHSSMTTLCVVHTDEDFEAWMEVAKDPYHDAEGEPIPMRDVGELFYNRFGCAQCHSLDGSVLQGPSFQGLWGKEERMTDGATMTVDENYVLQSIWEPNAHVVEGYQAVMPTFKGKMSQKDVTAMIEFMKTIE